MYLLKVGRYWITVYPRVCGVDSSTTRFAAASIGLSPRVRGRFSPNLAMNAADRFIPACAG